MSFSAQAAVENAEHRLGFQFPASLREWYCDDESIDILTRYSNQDPPIPIDRFSVIEWNTLRLLPFKYENQGVCTWSISLDGSDDPPVYVDVDTNGKQWNMQATHFSAHVYSCVWDYLVIMDQPSLVQAQNEFLSEEAVGELRRHFSEQPPTFGWPSSTQRRFAGKECAILFWADEGQADWFVGARDAKSLEAGLRIVWNLDSVGPAFYHCTELGKATLDRMRAGGAA